MLRTAIVVGTVVLSVAKGLGGATLAGTTEPIVTVAWLSQHLHDRGVVVLHVSSPDVYKQEHIPGSEYLAPGLLESNSMGSGASMDMSMPSESEITAKLEKLGISDESHVVVVFNGNGLTQATRVLFLMSYAGLEHTSLLDGGLPAWKRSGLAVTQEVPAVAVGRITGHAHPTVAVDYTWMQAHLGAAHNRIVDARTPAYYGGPAQASMSMAAGHIPGAVNVPYNSLVDENNMLLAPAVLEAHFRAAGVAPGDTVLAYCHVGVQATMVVLGARILGYPVKMYAGSFHDWSAHNLPTEGGKP